MRIQKHQEVFQNTGPIYIHALAVAHVITVAANPYARFSTQESRERSRVAVQKVPSAQSRCKRQ